jgi:hypothetical protein
MLLTNHALTGVLLGLTIDNPAELAAAGVASHLVQDALPHFGNGEHMDPGTPLFMIIGSIDFAGATIVTVAACMAWPHRAANLVIGAVSAGAPDFIWIPESFFGRRWMEYHIPGYRPLRRFLGSSKEGGIQWYQEPPGLITEVLWAALMLTLLYGRLP